MTTPADLPALLARAADGDLSDAEARVLEQLLTADPAARRKYVDHLLLDVLLAEHIGADGVTGTVDLLGAGPAPPPPAAARRTLRRVGRPALAVSVALVLGAAVAWWPSRGTAPPVPVGEPAALLARVVECEGLEVLGTGDASSPAVAGQELRPGQTIRTTGEDGFAVVDRDAVRLELSGDTTVRLPGDRAGGPGDPVFLSHGVLCVGAAANTRPAAVATPHALVHFAAAAFTCSATADATYVEVEGGSVRVIRQADGAPAEVSDGFVAVVSSRADDRFSAEQTPARLHRPAVTVKASMTGGAVGWAAFSADGAALTTLSRGQLCVWDASTGARRRDFNPSDSDCRAAALSADGGVFAGLGRRSVIRVIDATGPGELLSFPGGPRGSGAVALSAGGRWVAVAQHHEKNKMTASVRPVRPGAPPVSFPVGTWPARALALSADGGLVAVATAEGEVGAYRSADGREVGRFRLAGAVSAVAFSHDDRRLVGVSTGGTVAVWDTVTRTELWRLRAAGRSFRSAAFAPGGGVVAAGTDDGTTEAWRAADGAGVLSLKLPSPGAVAALAFSPDARTLATAAKRAVHLWSLPDAATR